MWRLKSIVRFFLMMSRLGGESWIKEPLRSRKMFKKGWGWHNWPSKPSSSALFWSYVVQSTGKSQFKSLWTFSTLLTAIFLYINLHTLTKKRTFPSWPQTMIYCTWYQNATCREYWSGLSIGWSKKLTNKFLAVNWIWRYSASLK